MFNTNKLFSGIRIKCGIPNLIKKLQDIFVGMLTIEIPQLTKQVSENLEDVLIEYQKCKPRFEDNPKDKRQFVNNMIRKFSNEYMNILGKRP